MEQRKLYKTLDNLIRQAPKYETNEELLKYVIQHIISTGELNIKSGRLWKLNNQKDGYVLVSQIGVDKKIEDGYVIKIKNYPQTLLFAKQRAFIDFETDKYLKSKGINLYSATGVGDRIKTKIRIKNNTQVVYLYRYLIAFNGKEVDEDFLNTLNMQFLE